MADYILAIDQGTTSSRAFIFDNQMNIVGRGQQEFAQIFPKSGWVEHDAADIWASVCVSINQAYMQANLAPSDIAAIGITNQRETTLVWDKATGAPVYNAIVWQDRRTDAICRELKACGHEAEFSQKTGLVLDPYFSGTKVKWILDTVEGARKRAENGELCFGTLDSYLIWKLSKGQAHVTDITNASRTLMYNINDFSWDATLTAHLDIPMTMLPEVRDCDAYFGTTNADIFGAEVPICGVAGDQHAALIGQACFNAGMMKATFGTGCFAVLNTGAKLVRSENRLISTIAYKIDNEVSYALEGSIFIAGAAVQWLRDGLGILDDAQQAGVLAQEADDTQEIYLVPAFAGLGAPHWDANARGAIYGLNRNTGPKEFARAALEAVCYQTYDLLDAMQEDRLHTPDDTILRVDGGMVASDYTLQFLADILNCPVDRPQILETTILGVAWLAGKNIGLYPQRDAFAKTWKREKQFTAKMDTETRKTKLAGWHDAVRRTLS